MFSNQRVRRLRVIELRSRRRGFPCRSRVATLAGLLEESSMRIGVTGRALLEGNARIFHGLVRHGVALLAGDLNVCPRQWEPGFCVIELSCYFPIGRAVTTLAFAAKAPLVLVFVTADAGPREPEIRLVQVLR